MDKDMIKNLDEILSVLRHGAELIRDNLSEKDSQYNNAVQTCKDLDDAILYLEGQLKDIS